MNIGLVLSVVTVMGVSFNLKHLLDTNYLFGFTKHIKVQYLYDTVIQIPTAFFAIFDLNTGLMHVSCH